MPLLNKVEEDIVNRSKNAVQEDDVALWKHKRRQV